MSGIAGIVGRGSLEELGQMAAAMSYRGPHRRCWSPAANILLAEVGHEIGEAASESIALTSPVRDLAGVDVGRTALARRMAGNAQDGLRQLRGDFALAFFDERSSGGLTLATDQLSFRSLYVLQLPGRIAFASDYKALLALEDCKAEVNRDALAYYLATTASDLKRPLLAGAKLLVRGAIARITADSFSADSYVQLPGNRLKLSRRESAQMLRGELEAVVRRHLIGRSRVAITLSAGLDSSTLLALIRHVDPQVRISTYTIGFGPDDPEIIGARRSAEHFRTEHHEVFFDNAELEHLLPRYVWLTEDLYGFGEAILQQKIVETVGLADRAVFAGHGADVAFAGMPRHRLLWLMGVAPPPLRGALRDLFKYTQMRQMPASWLGRQLTQRAYGKQATESLQVIGAQPVTMPAELLSLNGYLRANCNGMRSFLYHEPAEDRAFLTPLLPFLEVEVRDCAQKIPLSQLITARSQKAVLRDALVDLMPDFLRNRQKAIQRLRRDDSLPNALANIAAKFDVGRKMSARGLLHGDAVGRMLSAGSADQSHLSMVNLWTLVCSELWMQTFVDGRGRAPLA